MRISGSFRTVLVLIGVIAAVCSSLEGQTVKFAFSTDESFVITNLTREDHEVVGTDLAGSWMEILTTLSSGLPPEANIDALDYTSETNVYFSLDADAMLGGVLFADEDIIHWDGSNFSMAWDGNMNGLSERVDLNALDVIAASPFEFSFSIDATDFLNIGSFLIKVEDEDLVRFKQGSGFTVTDFSGILSGIPPEADLNAFCRKSSTEWLLSFDSLIRIGTSEYDDGDVLLWNPQSTSFNALPWFDANMQSVPERVELNAAGVPPQGPTPTPTASPTQTPSPTPTVTATPTPPPTPTPKWSQPPTFNPSSPEPTCFWGWGEKSSYGGTQIVADDWLSIDNTPFTGIRWWGSYVGWNTLDPPMGGPDAFQIALWTDVPAGVDFSFSHPGEMFREWIVSRLDVSELAVNCNYHTSTIKETTYEYYFDVPTMDWFEPQPGTIYWVSISAIYPGEEPAYPWAWLTRDYFDLDASIRIGDPTAPSIGSLFGIGEPIQNPSEIPWDTSYEILTITPVPTPTPTATPTPTSSPTATPTPTATPGPNLQELIDYLLGRPTGIAHDYNNDKIVDSADLIRLIMGLNP